MIILDCGHRGIRGRSNFRKIRRATIAVSMVTSLDKYTDYSQGQKHVIQLKNLPRNEFPQICHISISTRKFPGINLYFNWEMSIGLKIVLELILT